MSLLLLFQGPINWVASSTDLLGITDQRTLAQRRVLTAELLGLLDSRTKVHSARQTRTDVLGLLDSRSQKTTGRRSQTDPEGLLDPRTQRVTGRRSQTDALGLLDSRLRKQGRALIDALGLLDSTARTSATKRTATDPEGLTDLSSLLSSMGRPYLDVSDGGWTPVGTSELWDALDEVTPSDSDYIRSSSSPAIPDICEIRLYPMPSSGSQTVRYRYRKNENTGDRIDLTVRLVEGTSILETWTHSDIGTETTAQQTVAATITDWSDLRLRFEAVKV